MELGGSAPGVVCEDADIDSVLETIYYMRYSNSGQMCDGLKRLIVHTSRYDELVTKLSKKILLPMGLVSCVSCHEGYSQNHGKLVISNAGSALCFACHDL